MKSQLYCLLALIMVTTAPLAATAASSNYGGSCAITFEVQKSIMKDFSGVAACEPFEISATNNMVRIPVITVEVASIDTGNSRRDRDMRKMLDYETFPLVKGNNETLVSNGFLLSEDNLAKIPESLTFALTIRDVTQKITATVVEPRIDSSNIEATLLFDLSLSSFDLNPPSFLGIVRVKDTVKVRVTMSLDRNPTSTTSSSAPTAQE